MMTKKLMMPPAGEGVRNIMICLYSHGSFSLSSSNKLLINMNFIKR